MSELVPIGDSSPAIQLARLNVYRVTDWPQGKIVELWLVGCKPTNMRSALRDRSVPRQLATIFFPRGSDTFALSFYPDDGTAQIVKDLPLTDLPLAVADLVAAGFGKGEKNPTGATKRLT